MGLDKDGDNRPVICPAEATEAFIVVSGNPYFFLYLIIKGFARKLQNTL